MPRFLLRKLLARPSAAASSAVPSVTELRRFLPFDANADAVDDAGFGLLLELLILLPLLGCQWWNWMM